MIDRWISTERAAPCPVRDPPQSALTCSPRRTSSTWPLRTLIAVTTSQRSSS